METNFTNTSLEGAMGDTREDVQVRTTNPPGHLFCSGKRLRQELMDMAINPPPLCSAGLKGSDLYEWTATIIGPQESVYEGGMFMLNLTFPKDYPFKPPNVRFATKIYHCNVNPSGRVCLDILNQKWTPAMTVSSLLVSICSLMSDCNPRDPLMGKIATLYLNDRKEHDRRAREHTRRFAFPKSADNDQ